MVTLQLRGANTRFAPMAGPAVALVLQDGYFPPFLDLFSQIAAVLHFIKLASPMVS